MVQRSPEQQQTRTCESIITKIAASSEYDLITVCNSIEHKNGNMGKTAAYSAETHLSDEIESNHIMCVMYIIYI